MATVRGRMKGAMATAANGRAPTSRIASLKREIAEQRELIEGISDRIRLDQMRGDVVSALAQEEAREKAEGRLEDLRRMYREAEHRWRARCGWKPATKASCA